MNQGFYRELKKVISSTKATINRIENLTAIPRTLLEIESEKEGSGPGDLQVGSIIDSLNSLQKWAEAARSAVKPGEQGRPPLKEIDKAVLALRYVWEKALGARPTRSLNIETGRDEGVFLEFCRGALYPILDERNIKVDLEHSVRKAIKRPMDKTR